MAKMIFLVTVLFSISLHASDVETLVRMPKSFIGKEVKNFINDHFRHDFYSVGYVSNKDLLALPPSVRSHIQVLDSEKWARGQYDVETLAVKALEKDVGEYLNYTALTQWLQNLQSQNPDIVSLRSAGKSVQGRELWYVVLSDNASVKENEPVTSFIANMHGDETAGREVMVSLIERLVTSYKTGDQRIRRILDHSQTLIMPSMNPDGFELRRRGNANNVDLNRNFDDPITGNSRNPQIEMKAIVKFHQDWAPTLGLNYHGGTVCFNLPWDHKANRPVTFADDAFISEIALDYASQNQTMYRNNEFNNGVTYGYEWYQVTGGLQDWSILKADSIHATVELSHIKWPNARDLPTIYSENEESMLRVLEKGQFGVHLEVVRQNGQPVTEFLVKTSDSNRWISNKGSNFIHRLTIDRNQNVMIQVDGVTKEFNLSPSRFDGSFERITL
jgi:hypothetical protein